MYIFPIVYFFVLFFCLGYSVLRLLELKIEKIFEKIAVCLGIGLAIFPLISIILNIFSLLYWWLFLIIALILPLYDLFMLIFNLSKKHKEKTHFGLKLKKEHIYIAILLLIFFVHFFVYLSGAFKYPYLEDGDPLAHAEGVKYVQVLHTYTVPDKRLVTHYIEPYPPFYDVFMAMHLQISNNDMYWVLKFFNVLVISLGILFMYYTAKLLFKSNKKALFAAFLLAVIPSYLSHFIFSASYGITLIIPAIYCMLKIKDDEKNAWWIAAALVFSGVFLIQPITSAIFLGIAVLYLIVHIDIKKIRIYLSLAIFLGLFLSQSFWIPMFYRYGVGGVAERLGFQIFVNPKPIQVQNPTQYNFGNFLKDNILLKEGPYIPEKDTDSSGGKIYTLKDFIYAPTQSKMDQPIGLGFFIFLLLLFSLIILLINFRKIIKKENRWNLFLILAVVFMIIGIEGNLFLYKFAPHRLWAYLAIPLVLLCAEGMFVIFNSIRDKKISFGILLIFIMGILITSGYPKYVVETSYWPPGPEFTSQEEVQGYVWIHDNLPFNTPVLPLCSQHMKVISMNMMSYLWDREIDDFKIDIGNKTAEEIYNFAKLKNYKYMTYDTTCLQKMDINATNNKLLEIANSGKFNIAFQNQGMLVFKLN